jgi:hypothetical protein
LSDIAQQEKQAQTMIVFSFNSARVIAAAATAAQQQQQQQSNTPEKPAQGRETGPA